MELPQSLTQLAEKEAAAEKQLVSAELKDIYVEYWDLIVDLEDEKDKAKIKETKEKLETVKKRLAELEKQDRVNNPEKWLVLDNLPKYAKNQRGGEEEFLDKKNENFTEASIYQKTKLVKPDLYQGYNNNGFYFFVDETNTPPENVPAEETAFADVSEKLKFIVKDPEGNTIATNLEYEQATSLMKEKAKEALENYKKNKPKKNPITLKDIEKLKTEVFDIKNIRENEVFIIKDADGNISQYIKIVGAAKRGGPFPNKDGKGFSFRVDGVIKNADGTTKSYSRMLRGKENGTYIDSVELEKLIKEGGFKKFDEVAEKSAAEEESKTPEKEKAVPDATKAIELKNDFQNKILAKEEAGVATRAEQIKFLRELESTVNGAWLRENLPNYQELTDLIEDPNYIKKWEGTKEKPGSLSKKESERKRMSFDGATGKWYETTIKKIGGVDKKEITEVAADRVSKLDASIDFMNTRIEANKVLTAYTQAKTKFDAIPDDKRYEMRGVNKVETTLFITEKKKYITALEALVASQEERGIKNTPEAKELRDLQVSEAKTELEKLEKVITPLEKQDAESKSYIAEKVFTLEALGNNPEIRNTLSTEAITLLQSLPLLKNEGLVLQDPPKRPFLERSGSNTGSFTATLTFERETGRDFFEKKGKQITVQFFITLTKDGFAISTKKDGSGQEPHIISTHPGEAIELRKQLAAISGGVSETSEVAKFLNEEIEHETGKKIGNAWVEGNGKDAKINISTGTKVANFDPTKKTEPLTDEQKEKLEELIAQKEQLLSDYPELAPVIVAAPAAPTAPTTTLETPEEKQAREDMEKIRNEVEYKSFILKIEAAERAILENTTLISKPKEWLVEFDKIYDAFKQEIEQQIRESAKKILTGGVMDADDYRLQREYPEFYDEITDQERGNIRTGSTTTIETMEQKILKKENQDKIVETTLRILNEKTDDFFEFTEKDILLEWTSRGDRFQITINKKVGLGTSLITGFSSNIKFRGAFQVSGDKIVLENNYDLAGGGITMSRDLKKGVDSLAREFTNEIKS